MGEATCVPRLRADVGRVVGAALPLYLSMVAVSVSALVNTAVLGRLGTSALAAFAFTGAVFVPAQAAVTGAVRGVMPFLGSADGDPAAVRRVVADGTWLALSVGVAGGLAVAAAPLLGAATGVPPQILSNLGVLPWLLAGVVVLTSFGSMASSSLVGLGRTRVVARAGLLGALCTAVLSPLLVLGDGGVSGLGLAGSGIALLVASAATLCVNLLWLRRHLAFSLAATLRQGPDLRRTLKLARVGIPMAGTVLVKFTVLGVVALAAARVSATAAAGHSVATALTGLTFTAAVAVGLAGVPLVGRRGAAGDVTGTRRAVAAGVLVAGLLVAAPCAALLVVPAAVTPLFSADPAVRALLTSLLPVVALAVVADSVQAVIGFGLTGLKRTVPSFVVFSVGYGVLAIVAVPVAAAFGVVGLWTAVAVTNAVLILGQATAFWRVTRGLRPPDVRSDP